MKIRKTIYWIVGLFVFFGWVDLVWGQDNYAIGDTLTFKVNGLVCSFCAHGLNKGIGKMDYTDEKGIFVDIDNQIVRVILNKRYKAIPSSVINQTIEVIQNSGYEVHKITYQNRVIMIIPEKKK